ncbi:MAG: hypothetical protein ChlgKO_10480 [Chlamydiales bacterium]
MAELLAATVLELFPKAQLLYTAASREGFFADFIFPEPVAKEQLSFVEQRMRAKIDKGLSVQKLDMIGESLAHFLRDNGQVVAAALLYNRLGEVLPVIQIENYAHICEQPFAQEVDIIPKLEKIEACEPYTFRGHQEQVTRISGNGKKAKTHLKLGKNLFSFLPEKPVTRNGPVEIIWHGEGSKLFSQLCDLLSETNIEQVKLPPECTLKEYLRVTGKKAAATVREEDFHNQNFSYGLLDPLRSTALLTLQRLPKKKFAETLISSLQFSSKIYKMLDLTWHAYLMMPTRRGENHEALVEMMQESAEKAGIELETKIVPGKGLPRISLRVKDIFQKEWTLTTFLLEEAEGEVLLSHKLFTSIERLIALLLENRCEYMVNSQ